LGDRVRSECLDWLLILERVLRVFVAHYNSHRPHRSLNFAPPDPTVPSVSPARSTAPARIEQRDRLGELSHDYSLAA
jgi:hypothetical protein